MAPNGKYLECDTNNLSLRPPSDPVQEVAMVTLPVSIVSDLTKKIPIRYMRY